MHLNYYNPVFELSINRHFDFWRVIGTEYTSFVNVVPGIRFGNHGSNKLRPMAKCFQFFALLRKEDRSVIRLCPFFIYCI